MQLAQDILSAIYLAFLGLLTPFLEQASHAQGVAGTLDIITFAEPILGIFVLIGAVASKLSAAIADSIGRVVSSWKSRGANSAFGAPT